MKIKAAREAGQGGDPFVTAGLGVYDAKATLARTDFWDMDLNDIPGMSDAVLANALVPFYSTKRSGTGLGLALAREIDRVARSGEPALLLALERAANSPYASQVSWDKVKEAYGSRGAVATGLLPA